MKNIGILLVTITLLLINYELCNAYTPPATYDPSGSEQNEYEINCNYSRSYYSLINPFSVILYDSKCGGKVEPIKPTPPIIDQEDSYIPDGSYIWEPDDEPANYPREEYERELKAWADETANMILIDLVGRYQRGEYVNYLTDDMLFDMANYGYQFKEPMEECLSYWVANDVDNIGNMIESGYDMAGYMAGTVRNCYIKVRHVQIQY
jgi:hypothetical protein